MDGRSTSSAIIVTYANIVVTSSGCQSSFGTRLEGGRVDWGILVMPSDQQRVGLHVDSNQGPLYGRLVKENKIDRLRKLDYAGR